MNHRNVYTHLLVEDGLGLTTVTGLLAHVTALSLHDLRVLALLVLRYLVGTVTNFEHHHLT